MKTWFGFEHVIVSSRVVDGSMIVDSYEIDSNGTLTQVSNDGTGVVGAMATRAPGTADFVTAVGDSTDDLTMISWSSGLFGNALRRTGTQRGGEISEVSLASWYDVPSANHPNSWWQRCATATTS